MLEFKTEEINREICDFREELKGLTKNILDNREKITEEYKTTLSNQRAIKQRELESLKKTKPKKVLEPNGDNTDEETQEKIKKLKLLKTKEADIIKEILSLKNEINDLTKRKAILDKAIAQIHILTKNVGKEVQEIIKMLESVGYHDMDFFSFEPKVSNLINISDRLKEELEQKKIKLRKNEKGVQSDDCLEAQKQKVEENIKKLVEQINEPNKKYQNYLSELKAWEKQISDIQGNERTPNTLSYLNSKLSELDNIPTKNYRARKTKG